MEKENWKLSRTLFRWLDKEGTVSVGTEKENDENKAVNKNIAWSDIVVHYSFGEFP